LFVFGPALIMLLQGDPLHPKSGALILEGLLLLALARRSAISWTLLLLWNLVYVVATLPAIGGAGMLFGAPVLGIVSLACAALLLSRPMRAHVGVR
jgi:hypothetical protein